jgi:hypothetical protein
MAKGNQSVIEEGWPLMGVKYGKQSLTISAKPVGVGAVCQRLIPADERSALPTRIAATESVSLCVRMKN